MKFHYKHQLNSSEVNLEYRQNHRVSERYTGPLLLCAFLLLCVALEIRLFMPHMILFSIQPVEPVADFTEVYAEIITFPMPNVMDLSVLA
jgi:hypothetical protein